MESKEKKYSVCLDGSKCLSYTLNSVKYQPNRTFNKSESDVEKFFQAGVFLIHEIEKSEPDNVEKSDLENNDGDDQDLLPKANGSVNKDDGNDNKRPSGVIKTSSLSK